MFLQSGFGTCIQVNFTQPKTGALGHPLSVIACGVRWILYMNMNMNTYMNAHMNTYMNIKYDTYRITHEYLHEYFQIHEQINLMREAIRLQRTNHKNSMVLWNLQNFVVYCSLLTSWMYTLIQLIHAHWIAYWDKVLSMRYWVWRSC